MQSPQSYASRVPPRVLRAHVIMGALQITIGCLVILLSIVGLAVGSMPGVTLSGSGIWAGPFFIIAGVSGVVAGKSVKRCTLGCIITCLVFSIITSVMGFIALVTEATLTALNRSSINRSALNSRYYYSNIGQVQAYSHSSTPSVQFEVYCGFNIACTLLFAFEFVLAIVHSAFACRASCCCVQDAMTQDALQQQQQQVFSGQQIVYSAGQLQPGAQLVTFPSHLVTFIDPGSQQVVIDSAVAQPPFNPAFDDHRRPPAYESRALEKSGLP